MKAIATRWDNAAKLMTQGLAPIELSIGEPAEWPTLAPALASRAELLKRWAADAKLWRDL